MPSNTTPGSTVPTYVKIADSTPVRRPAVAKKRTAPRPPSIKRLTESGKPALLPPEKKQKTIDKK